MNSRQRIGESAEALPTDAHREPLEGRRVIFVTGRLAEPALRRVLTEMAPPFAYDVTVLNITVAALMTTAWIAHNLALPGQVAEGTGLVLIPGLCEGDPQVIEEKFGVRVEKGPKDLREIPRHFGRAAAARDYGAWDIDIIAEINNAPRLTREALRAAADYFRGSGADVIDVGCTPGLSFPALGDVVRELTAAGMRVSVDTFDPGEIRTAVAAGAELVLSVNGSNIDVAHDLAGTGARVVVVPDLGRTLDTLEPSLEKLERWGIRYLIDPILEPIGFGFMASLERYADVRRRYPEAELLMGIGNLTELTAADSTGVNALLIAICQELGVRAVLTTEVIPWARGAVREIDVARRLMRYAVTQHTIPKDVDDRLVVRGTDIQEIFAQLGVNDATHAFYLGKELARASLAVTLGKTYRQEGALSWGYLTPPDDAKSEHLRLTQPPQRTRVDPDARTRS
jgi:dihydropteroate synthase